MPINRASKIYIVIMPKSNKHIVCLIISSHAILTTEPHKRIKTFLQPFNKPKFAANHSLRRINPTFPNKILSRIM